MLAAALRYPLAAAALRYPLAAGSGRDALAVCTGLVVVALLLVRVSRAPWPAWVALVPAVFVAYGHLVAPGPAVAYLRGSLGSPPPSLPSSPPLVPVQFVSPIAASALEAVTWRRHVTPVPCSSVVVGPDGRRTSTRRT